MTAIEQVSPKAPHGTAPPRRKFGRPDVALAIRPLALHDEYEPQEKPEVETRNGVAIVRICGPLTHHPTIDWWSWSYFDSYDAIGERFQAALETNPRAIVLVIDSPGGEVSGCFELAASMRASAKAKNIPLVALAEGMACSAGYALACAADRIFATETSLVGSIGVITAIADMTGAIASWGARVEVITSGERKADGHPYERMTPEAIAATQRIVDDLAAVFFRHVAAARSTTPEGVQALEAECFVGSRAKGALLIDDVATLDSAIAMAPARPAPAPAVSNPSAASPRRAALISNRVPSGTKQTKAATMTNKLRAESAPEDENKDEARAEMEQADFARLRSVLGMEDMEANSAQAVVDAAADKIEGQSSEEGDGTEQAKRAAVAEAALATATSKLNALGSRVAELEKVAAKSAKRDRDDAVIAALTKRGLSSQADRDRFLALADKHGLEAALASIESSGPPSGTVSGSAPALSTGAGADIASGDGANDAARLKAAHELLPTIAAEFPGEPKHIHLARALKRV